MAIAVNRTETRMQRRLLKAFLDAEPADIELQRPTFVKTPAGGLKATVPAKTLSKQRFRLVPFKKRMTKITRDTPDGNIINLEYVLIGHHDADVKPGDYFEWNNQMYDVVSLEPRDDYRIAANISYRGKNNNTWG